MRNSNRYLPFVVILSVMFSSCGIGKILKRKSTQNSERRETQATTRILRDKTVFNQHDSTFSDSSRHIYRVTIFPNNGFTYSTQNGFTGQAKRIEISGVADRLTQGKISELNLENTHSDSIQSLSETLRIVDHTVSKEVKRGSAIVFIIITIGCLIALCWWKFR